MSGGEWRRGRHQPRNVYRGDEFVAVAVGDDDRAAELAEAITVAMNVMSTGRPAAGDAPQECMEDPPAAGRPVAAGGGTNALALDDDGDLPVWAVRCGNYRPAEIDSLWLRLEDAERRAAELGGMWEVERSYVFGPLQREVWDADSSNAVHYRAPGVAMSKCGRLGGDCVETWPDGVTCPECRYLGSLR